MVAPMMKPEFFGSKVDQTLAGLCSHFFKKYPSATMTMTVVTKSADAGQGEKRK